MPTDETPPEVKTEPILPTGIVLTEKQKMARHIVTQVLGMVSSKWNVVMFENKPLLWMQYYCGLALGMPTIIVLLKSDTVFIPLLKRSKLVKATFEIEAYKEPYATHVTDKIGHFIKQHPDH